jgi:hypothetical protein
MQRLCFIDVGEFDCLRVVAVPKITADQVVVFEANYRPPFDHLTKIVVLSFLVVVVRSLGECFIAPVKSRYQCSPSFAKHRYSFHELTILASSRVAMMIGLSATGASYERS